MKSRTLKYFCLGMVLLAAAGLSARAQTAGAASPTGPAQADTPPPSETALVGDLLDDPASKAVLDKDLPGLTTNPHINYLRSRTLKEVQTLANGKITDAALVQTDKDLLALPKKSADAPPAAPPQ